jgi:hypothetical protein
LEKCPAAVELGAQNFHIRHAELPESSQSITDEYVLNDPLAQCRVDVMGACLHGAILCEGTAQYPRYDLDYRISIFNSSRYPHAI